jgi:hypothetical protein
MYLLYLVLVLAIMVSFISDRAARLTRLEDLTYKKILLLLPTPINGFRGSFLLCSVRKLFVSGLIKQ